MTPISPTASSNGSSQIKNRDLLTPTDHFVDRHLGSTGAKVQKMLDALGVPSLDALIDETIPANIRMGLSADEVDAADLVVVLTDHDDFDWQLVLDRSVEIFDTRNRLRGDHVRRL